MMLKVRYLKSPNFNNSLNATIQFKHVRATTLPSRKDGRGRGGGGGDGAFFRLTKSQGDRQWPAFPIPG
jgi:hypothetical protein